MILFLLTSHIFAVINYNIFLECPKKGVPRQNINSSKKCPKKGAVSKKGGVQKRGTTGVNLLNFMFSLKIPFSGGLETELNKYL